MQLTSLQFSSVSSQTLKMIISYYPSSSSSLHPNHQFNSKFKPLNLKPCGVHFYTKHKLYEPSSVKVHVSAWDDKPYQVLPGGEISYYDERDIVSFLDPPKELVPLDPGSYNPAAYLWKKIDDIPEERRHRLLALLNPRLILRAWEVAGTRYDNPKLAKQSASSLFTGKADSKLLEFWHCRTNGGPLAVAWINYFKTALFCCNDGQCFGRIIDASVLGGLSRSFAPMYFKVKEVTEVMSTEQPCDLAYEFGSGLLDLQEYPKGFPKPGKHPSPFNDEVVIYVRHVGPGVVVGQAWQEGVDLKQVPKKLCSEILMVKDYAHSDTTW